MCENEGPHFSDTRIFFNHNDRKARQIIEAYIINETDSVISDPSVELHEEEIKVLNLAQKFLCLEGGW